MKTLLMLKGLPASGKSTFAKELISNDSTWKRVNKDDLREMVDNSVWNKKNEANILDTRNVLIQSWLNKGYNVVCDDTNFADKHEKALRELAEKCGAEFKVNDSFLNVPLLECIERDSKRSKPVGEKVIRSMYKQYLYKFPERKDYRWLDSISKNWAKEDCYIVDLDGTLALHDGRNPYDGDKCDTDIVNTPLMRVIESLLLLDTVIIFVSGRDAKYMNKTSHWLQSDCDIPYPTLLMRPEGDKRPDTEVKKEIYETYIKDRYNVIACFDDRPKVVAMWRSLGLFVLDCNQFLERGDF
jgi:predicted kinase